MTYVFLGGVSEAPGIRLTRFGERFELTPELAKEIVEHRTGIPAIPADKFDALVFTAEELQKYGAAASHEHASAEFLKKKKRVLEMLHEIRSKEGKK